MTTSEASNILGISKQDLVYWARRTGVRMINKGKRKVFKFTDTDLEVIKIKLNR